MQQDGERRGAGALKTSSGPVSVAKDRDNFTGMRAWQQRQRARRVLADVRRRGESDRFGGER